MENKLRQLKNNHELAAWLRHIQLLQEALDNYRIAWRVLLEVENEGLTTSPENEADLTIRDQADHLFFTLMVKAYFETTSRLAAFPECTVTIMDAVEWDEFAAYLTACDGFREAPEVVALGVS